MAVNTSNTCMSVRFPFNETSWPTVSEQLKELTLPQDSLCLLEEKLMNLWAAVESKSVEKIEIADTPFEGLILFLQKHFTDSERKLFLGQTLPFIVNAALACEDLAPADGLQIMTQSDASSAPCRQVELGKKFTCSLVATQFLSLFPECSGRSHMSMPHVNFTEWFQVKIPTQREKTRCVINYFNRMLSRWDAEERVDSKLNSPIIFSRICIPKEERLTWEKLLDCKEDLCAIVVEDNERIEDTGPGTVHVDFANEYIGGGVLGAGRVQEEIRFCLCPELMAALIFQESMTDHEAIMIEGFEQFSDYSGYANSFKFKGDFTDPALVKSPSNDNNSMMETALVAIDAIPFAFYHKSQYSEYSILREIRKAHCGFAQPTSAGSVLDHEGIVKTSDSMRQVVTGNWGCGAFGGDPQLKSMIQWIAASIHPIPSVRYCTFADRRVADLERITTEVIEKEWTVKDMAKTLFEYWKTCDKISFFEFIGENLKR